MSIRYNPFQLDPRGVSGTSLYIWHRVFCINNVGFKRYASQNLFPATRLIFVQLRDKSLNMSPRGDKAAPIARCTRGCEITLIECLVAVTRNLLGLLFVLEKVRDLENVSAIEVRA